MRPIKGTDASLGKKKDVNSYIGKSWLFLTSYKHDQLGAWSMFKGSNPNNAQDMHTIP